VAGPLLNILKNTMPNDAKPESRLKV